MKPNHVYDMIIVGGGPGGYTSALYAARAGLDTVVLEKLSAGGQMALSQQIDNYPGFEDGIDGFTLGEKMQQQAEKFGARYAYEDVLSVTQEACSGLFVVTSNGGAYKAKAVIVATGATARYLGLPGEKELIGLNSQQIVENGITLVPEGRRVFPNLTVLENLQIGAYLRNDKEGIAKDIRWIYDLFPRLEERSWQMAGTLSGGEQQMLAVGRALMSRPKVLMMDEPSLGLAPLIIKDIFKIIQEINRQGMTILLIEQNANMALKVADIAYVLETGRITMTGSGRELLENPEIKAAYLGKKK